MSIKSNQWSVELRGSTETLNRLTTNLKKDVGLQSQEQFSS